MPAAGCSSRARRDAVPYIMIHLSGSTRKQSSDVVAPAITVITKGRPLRKHVAGRRRFGIASLAHSRVATTPHHLFVSGKCS